MVSVKKSIIQGVGLFANRDISIDEVIIDYRNIGGWYNLHVDKLTEYQINHNWIIMKGDSLCETTDNEGLIFYINHSRQSNTNWFIKNKFITASRQIKCGEEITIDYRLEERSNRTHFPDWI